MKKKVKKSNRFFYRRFRLIFFSVLPLILPMCFVSSLLPAQEKADKQERIVETVIVENIEVPVRVFDGKQPVGGLTKQDFELYVNGKKKEINGFYQTRKKLELSGKERRSTASPKESDVRTRPRLFVLIFNLSDYHQDLTSALDLLFKSIIRPNDRLMAITNRFFFPQWKIEDPEKTKREILKILDKELKGLRFEMLRFQNELKALAINFKSRIYDPGEQFMPHYPAHIFREFFITYQFILEDIKDHYLSLPVDQYIKIAEYLKAQQFEKWVLNFYQLGRLPLIDNLGQIQEEIDHFAGGLDKGIGKEREMANQKPTIVGIPPPNLVGAKKTIKSLYLDFLSELYGVDDLLVNDISKAFLNSGATFHTLIMKPVNPGFSGDFKYQPIGTDSENVLKTLSRLTGGSIVRSNKMKDFLQDIIVKEDIIYMLTYVPTAGKKKQEKLKVALDNKNYRVVYDDQQRVNAFKKAKKKLAQENPDKDIEIKAVSYNRDGEMLTVKLDNIKMVHFDGERFGAVQARIKIVGQNSKLIANFEKTYRGIKEEGIFQAKLPPLPRGNYSVVLEVKDLFSLNNFYVGDAVTITKK